jgi:hypothetical protein
MKTRKTCFVPKALAGLALLLLFLHGCGYKDKPIPPQQVVPKSITDLRYQLSDKGVTLYWSFPVETVTGRDVTEISSFEVYRAVVPADKYCADCPIPWGRPINIPGGAVPDEGKKTATYETTLLRPGNMYFFKVRSKAGWWAESDDANVVSFLWNIPAMAPEGLKAEVGDSRIALAWQPVSQHRDGTPVTEQVRYQVYRSEGGNAFQPLGKPIDQTSFVDTSVKNGRSYFYKIQALSVYEQAVVGGGESETISASPLDRTPPAVPKGVHVIHSGSAIKVFWEPVADKDLAGYNIYRRIPGEKKAKHIGTVNTPYVMFTDTKAPMQASRIYYSVASFDQQKPANEGRRSAEVMILLQ